MNFHTFDSSDDYPGVMRHRFTCQDLSGSSHRTGYVFSEWLVYWCHMGLQRQPFYVDRMVYNGDISSQPGYCHCLSL